MNARRLAVSLAMVTGLTLRAMPVHAFETGDVAGVWMLQKTKFGISAVMYTTLLKDGSCTQALKLAALGKTKWGVDRCAWSLQQNLLSIKIVSSPTQPEKVGETSTAKVLSATADTLVTEDQKKKEQQSWSRTAAWPAEFTDAFNTAYAAPTAPAP